MITVTQQSKLIDRIKSLPEIELISVLEDIREHLNKNDLSHLLDDDRVAGLEEEIQSLEEDKLELEEERDDLQDDLNQISNICNHLDGVEPFEEDAFDQLREGINEIKAIV